VVVCLALTLPAVCVITLQIKSDAAELARLKALVAELSDKGDAKSAKIVNLKKTIEAMHMQVKDLHGP